MSGYDESGHSDAPTSKQRAFVQTGANCTHFQRHETGYGYRHGWSTVGPSNCPWCEVQWLYARLAEWEASYPDGLSSKTPRPAVETSREQRTRQPLADPKLTVEVALREADRCRQYPDPVLNEQVIVVLADQVLKPRAEEPRETPPKHKGWCASVNPDPCNCGVATRPASDWCPHYDLPIVNQPGCPDCASEKRAGSPVEPAEELFDRYPVGTLFQKKSDGRVLAMTPDDGVTHEARAPEKASGERPEPPIRSWNPDVI